MNNSAKISLIRTAPGSIALACALLLAAPLTSSASTVVLNFDSVNADGGGIDATSYLASYGVTLTGVKPLGATTVNDGQVGIWSDLQMYYVGASSGKNFLLQQTSGAPVNSYTLNFSTALDSVGFTRIKNTYSNLVAGWTATAYAGSTFVTSVGEAYGGGSFSAATYTLTGPGITSLVISADGHGRAGIASAMIDDLTLTSSASVPDSAGTLGLMALSVALLVAARRRFAQ
jgi:hypothetical protein